MYQSVKVILSLAFGVLLGSTVLAQEFTISGYIEDRHSGERIPSVEIYFPTTKHRAVTNQYGYYSYVSPTSDIELMVLHVAYETLEFKFELSQDTTLNISLITRTLNLDEIEILDHPYQAVDNTLMSQHSIETTQVEKLPVLLNEPDIQKTLHMLPGVQAGPEGTSGLYVRGGRSDQNLILLDGLPIYNPNHLFGFFSVFPNQAIKSVKLIKGGFPARYGERISSVIDYTMKEGNLREFKKQVSVGLVASRFFIEGPIREDKFSFLFSGRRTIIDLLLWPFRTDAEELINVHFYDLYLKTNYIASHRDRIYMSAYIGGDQMAYRLNSEDNGGARFLREKSNVSLGWGNRLVALRWNRVLGKRAFFNLLAGITSYRYTLKYKSDSQSGRDLSVSTSGGSWDSRITDATLKTDIEYSIHSKHYLRFGVNAIIHMIQPGQTKIHAERDDHTKPLYFTQTPHLRILSRTIAAYAENDMFLHHRVQVNFGLRASAYVVNDSHYWSAEPRVSANLRLSEQLAAKVSAVAVQQYIHLLTQGGARIPNDLWIASTEKINPQRGQQIAAGLVWSGRSSKYEVSLEIYARRMQNLIEYETNANATGSAILNWTNLVEEGRGQAVGMEFFLQKKTGRLTGWIGYTLASTTRHFDNLNNGISFPDGFDRRHDISIAGQYQIRERTTISAMWTFGSGYPVWLPIGRYYSLGPYSNCTSCNPTPSVDFGSINNLRAPNYHRLDININFQKPVALGTRTLSFGLYNAYGRRNPFYIYAKSGITERNNSIPVTITQAALFRWVPSVSYQLDF